MKITTILTSPSVATPVLHFPPLNCAVLLRSDLVGCERRSGANRLCGKQPVSFQRSRPNSGSPFVILGEYNPTGPLPTSPVVLPSGTVQDVKFYGQNYNFTLYALSYAGPGANSNEQTFVVGAAQSFSGTSASPGIQTLTVSNFSVYDGDLLAFCGNGPYYPQVANDATNSDAAYQNPLIPTSNNATPPAVGTAFTVGLSLDTNAMYGYIPDSSGNQGAHLLHRC